MGHSGERTPSIYPFVLAAELEQPGEDAAAARTVPHPDASAPGRHNIGRPFKGMLLAMSTKCVDHH